MRECDKQETRVCKKLGGKRQIGSGATPFLKGDGVLEDLLIECKTKDKPSKSIAVQKVWFEKSKEEAFSMNKSGAIVVIGFGDGTDYVCEELQMFEEHYKGYRALEHIESVIRSYEDKSVSKATKELLNGILDIIEGE